MSNRVKKQNSCTISTVPPAVYSIVKCSLGEATCPWGVTPALYVPLPLSSHWVCPVL